MVGLRQDTKGNFSARKRLPDDVREEYGLRHGQRFEAKFFAAADTGAAEAKRLFREWESDVGARIAAIRAERTGEGVATHPTTSQGAGRGMVHVVRCAARVSVQRSIQSDRLWASPAFGSQRASFPQSYPMLGERP